MAIDGVLLDFYGTVVDEDDAVIARILEIVRRDVGGGEDAVKEMADAWWRSFSRLCEEAHGDSFRSQRVLERESLIHALHSAGSSLDPDALSEELFRYWRRPTIRPDGERFIRSSTVPICVVSNIDRADLEAALSHHALNVEYVVTSEDARSYKPRPEMFGLALDRLGISAQDAIHIGDSATNDVAGARRAGIRSV